jgi:hypothetical protein
MGVQLENYLEDGANHQARAVLAFLQGSLFLEGIDSDKYSSYRPTVARWENCREQGYIVMIHSADYRNRLNIVFFEHRNSDSICAIKWYQTGINTPTIDTAQFGDVYKDKYDVSHSVGYGQIKEMCDWISAQMTEHWNQVLLDSEK